MFVRERDRVNHINLSHGTAARQCAGADPGRLQQESANQTQGGGSRIQGRTCIGSQLQGTLTLENENFWSMMFDQPGMLSTSAQPCVDLETCHGMEVSCIERLQHSLYPTSQPGGGERWFKF